MTNTHGTNIEESVTITISYLLRFLVATEFMPSVLYFLPSGRHFAFGASSTP